MCTVGTEQRGFTLLELLVVLVIASLAISLVGPGYQRLLPGLTLEAESRKLMALLRHARSQAILTGNEVSISQDAEGLHLSYREQPYTLPQGLQLELKEGPVQGEKAPTSGQILFYPRGDSSGGSFSLKMEARNEVINVDWLSGRVQRAAAPSEDEPRKKERAHKPEKGEGEGEEEADE